MSKALKKLCKPDIRLDKYDNEEYTKNPLLKFQINRVRARRHHDLLKSKAAATKIRLCRTIPEDLDDIIPISQKTYIKELHRYSKTTPIPKMLVETEQKMLGYVPKALKDKYPGIVADYMAEVHAEFDKIIKAFSLQKLLKPLEGDFVPQITPFAFKSLGKTDRYSVYLKNREKLKKHLMITYPFVRCIVYYSNIDFPHVLTDYSMYRENKEIESLDELVNAVSKDLSANTMFIKKDWYPKIVRIIKKVYRRRTIQKNLWGKIIMAASGLIRRQIVEVKIRTIEHINTVIMNHQQMPHFNLNTLCYMQLDLNPSIGEIHRAFHRMIDDISQVSHPLLDLSSQIDPQLPSTHTKLDTYINPLCMKVFHENLRVCLEKSYAPLINYLQDFRNDFIGLYGFDTQSGLEDFLSEERTFEEYLEKIEFFKEYLTKVRSLVQHVYFTMARVNQDMAIQQLKDIAIECIESVTKNIVKSHYNENKQICEVFEEIKRRALEIPRSTEQLLEGGEYMLYIKTVKIFEMQDRIQESLRIGGLLIELTDLRPEHIGLQIEAIRWFNNMKSIMDQSSSLFETYKSTFEERLGEVTKKLQTDLEEIVPDLLIIDDMSDSERFRDYYLLLREFIDKIEVFDDFVKWINKEEVLFKFPKSQYPVLETIRAFVVPFTDLIKLCIRWLRHYNVWMDGPFEYLEPKFVENAVDDYYKQFQALLKTYRNKIKVDLIGNPVVKFRGQTEDPDPEKHPVPIKLCVTVIQWIKDFRLGVRLVSIMCNPALFPRHWDEMSLIAGFDITPDAGTSLRKIIAYDLEDELDKYEIVSIGANKELQLQQNLQAMIVEWETMQFKVSKYKETNIQILSSMDDIQALLDDHILKTLSMRGSAFVKPAETEVKAWYEKLTRVNKTLDEWGKVQSKWLYLLPIFSSKDIVAQMPEEGKLFTQVDSIYRTYMAQVNMNPLVIETAPLPLLLEAMEEANIMLDDITNGVNNYLEKKRLYFPRFFFLSNDEMLEILSETKDPLRVQPFLNKCFEGISRLEFDEKLDINAMYSADKECVEFVNIVSTSEARGSVEKWLSHVEFEMLAAVKKDICKSYESYAENRDDRPKWALMWCQMVVICVSQIFWAADVHDALQPHDQTPIKTLFTKLKADLNDIVTLVRSPNLSNLNRITIKSLIVIDVHAKDVVEDLINKKVESDSDFQWLAQLRYYFEEDCGVVKIINASVPFANEYLGNSDRLVITPLTDRCYRTLVGAYQLHLNGAPEGPAGTGKTETTKDLAKALAVQCKVFNCSDGLDYKAMGKFFKGLASSGAWACFDEFNRIELEVLSVVAQQILCIIQAVRGNVQTFNFEGTQLVLNPACYICITMNPGYAGRSELPDNLKVLFRTVAMMVPDYAMIGEISLYSYGFVDARKLAVKIVTTYRLCSEQLSSQNHYDYGMRAVKTVLSACGNLKNALPDENEDILLLRSLTDVNLPKFLSFDVPLFEGIISDLFPGVTLPAPDYRLIETAFRDICEEINYQPKETFLIKIIQTYEMMIVRHGFMMVGEPFSGKSSTLSVLAKILSVIKEKHDSPYYQDVQFGILNPKSITMGQLYGAFDPISYEWTDGIAATLFRKFAVDTSPDRKWLIFDGPVDAVWIENMNTVLDDNKKLCLTSGEVVQMTNSMSMIFEVMDLAQASPATVSRCGMIYMEAVSLGWDSFAKSWMNTCNKEWRGEGMDELILEFFYWLIPPCLEFVRKQCVQLLKPGEINTVRTTLRMFQILMDEAVEEVPLEEYQKYLLNWYQVSITTALSWGVGGILNSDSREKFDMYVRDLVRGNIEECPIPEKFGNIDISVPPEGLIIDFFYVYKQKGAWKHWPEIVRRLEIEDGPMGIQVPTIDTVRYMQLLKLHVKYNMPMLLVGPTGTGKSFYTQMFLMSQLPENTIPAFIAFTVTIKANQTQDLVLTKLTKRKRGIYGPPRGQKSIIFIDDMNMPAKEIYGAQPPIELIRQYFDYGYWYDTKDISKLHLQDILILAACGLVGGSRQDVYARFLCHFNIFSINTFSEETMFKIFTTVLLTGLKKIGHASDVIGIVNSIVNATLRMYTLASEFLRPTPAKCHYIFNMRDISRVVLGCSLLRKESVENRRMFPKLWVHESMRVFYDRLVDENDRNWFYANASEMVKVFFKDSMATAFEEYVNDDGTITLKCIERVFFARYMDIDSTPEERKYEEVPNIKTLRDIAIANLQEYNATKKSKMNIVLFDYALEHLNKICRTISMPGGSSLLIGMGGSGRQSLTRLASQINGQILFQPEITKNYSMNDWRDDLKKVLKESGGRGLDTVFLFTEGQITSEQYLQDIDCLLNLGEVPNIFAIDEKQEILELVRLAAQGGNRNADVSPLQVFSFFINRCKQKLHIILCFSPIGNNIRTRVRLYPSLVNCCTIDWFEAWPESALEMVAYKTLGELEVTPEIQASIVAVCKSFHVDARIASKEFYQETGRMTYITSASYLELIKSYKNLLTKKQTELRESKMRYIGGLDTLAEAADAVFTMQIELNDLTPKLIVLAEQSRTMTAEIEAKTREASVATEQVKRDEIVANIQAEAATALKIDCEKDLAQAIPVLEEAIGALNTLKPTDIIIVKSMKNPPETIKLVMAAVCVMKGLAPDRVNDPASGKKVYDYWGPSKKLLGEMQFLQSLKDFDKDNINPDIMKKIRKDYIPHPSFKPEIVAKASSAAEGLCKWIIAMDMYDEVAKVVAPKKARLEDAEREYSETMKYLQEKKEMAAALAEKVAKLTAELEAANEARQRVEDEVELCKAKLSRAEQLLGGLGGEKSRWTEAAELLQKQYENLPGDILISCGIIAYLAPMISQYRDKSCEKWHKLCLELKIPSSKEYTFVDALGSGITIQQWNLYGLPRDTFSSENGVIMDNSSRYSLFIDPQGQANNWIKAMERNNRLVVLKFAQKDYMKKLETCIEFGNPVLIEGVLEDLDAPLDPILSKNTFVQSGIEYLSVGDNVIPLSSKFRMYLTSNLRNPHYLPEVFNKVTIINFALTTHGLSDQLLGIVVAKERPDLEELRQVLIVDGARNRAQLKEVEDEILKTLMTSGRDILGNESAIQILAQSKILSADIKIKQAKSKETEREIEDFRLRYKPVATHSSILYYCIIDLPAIDPMYQFSLAWYINLYVFSIENANKSKELDRRLKFLTDAITYNLYCKVCRSLFEKDKLLFSFILTTKILLATDTIDNVSFMFLLTGGNDIAPAKPNPNPSWITEKLWNDLSRLEQLTVFKDFIASFTQAVAQWKKIYDDAEPQSHDLPPPWNIRLNKFDRLLLLRALRPDKLIAGIEDFVSNELGPQFINPPPFDIAKSFEDANCLTPLIFILSAGSDPMGSLLLYAEKLGFDETFQSISLGQGQGPIALNLIERANEAGTWICLQNCHLAASWMPTLEATWENLDIYNTTPSFRLWLTSYPSDIFPTAILQNGVKMTNDPPTGLQSNLLRSYNSEPMNDDQFYTGCPEQDRAFTKLLYGICFFHAVVQERRKFGAMGWNISYGFNESDFQISVQQLLMFLNQYSDIPYDAITYLTGECNYGGRVTDAWDRRAIVTILRDYVNENVINDPAYRFSDISKVYCVPIRTDHSEVVRFIRENIPNAPAPEVFGLHGNAGITRDLQASFSLLDSMILNLGTVSHESDEQSEKLLLHAIEFVKSKLPPDFDIDVANAKYPVDYSESMNTVLVQEMQRFNTLLRIIRNSCNDVLNAIKGIVVMTPELEAVCNSISFKKIPAQWIAKSYPSLKPVASYIEDFSARLKWLDNWFQIGKPPTFWLSGFFFTQAFLTGATQNFARKYRIPIDTLTFDFIVTVESTSPIAPEDGVYVNGLFLEGARWDWPKKQLDEQVPKVLIDAVPMIHLVPVLMSSLKEGTRYKCPLYKTAERKGTLSTTGHSTNYVLPFLLNTQLPASLWVKRSVAMICQTND